LLPFVVDRISVSARGSRNSRGEAPTSNPSIRTASPLSTDERALDLAAQPSRLLDLGAAEHAPVAGGQRLRDRRGGAQDVDHDPTAAEAALRPA
jgi:hypothetical protein